MKEEEDREKEGKKQEEWRRPGVQRVVVYLPPAVMWLRSCRSASLYASFFSPLHHYVGFVSPQYTYLCIFFPASCVTPLPLLLLSSTSSIQSASYILVSNNKYVQTAPVSKTNEEEAWKGE